MQGQPSDMMVKEGVNGRCVEPSVTQGKQRMTAVAQKPEPATVEWRKELEFWWTDVTAGGGVDLE